MKLITFQSLEAVKYLINHGYLICDETYINQEKYGYAYNFITTNMAKKINREENIKYPFGVGLSVIMAFVLINIKVKEGMA